MPTGRKRARKRSVKATQWEKRVGDFSEEMSFIGERAERRGKEWDTWFHRTFGVVGPFISAVFGIIIFALCVAALGLVSQQTGSIVLASIHGFLLGKEGLFFLIFLFFSYMSYLSRAASEAYVPFSPLVGSVGAVIAFWLVAQAMKVVNAPLGVDALGRVASWIDSHLLWILGLALFIGYLALLIRTACCGRPKVAQERTVKVAGGRFMAKTRGVRRLYRSGQDRILGGVCGGIAEYLGVDPVIVRLLWVILTLLSFGAGVLAYIIAWIIIPRNPDDTWA